jgi:hypothetical protein
VNVTQAIEKVIQRSDNIKGNPADYADRRLRLLDSLQEVFEEVYWLRDWVWRRKRSTVTVGAADESASVPSDFQSFGESGGVWSLLASGGDGHQLDLVTESEIFEDREKNRRTNTPRKFALFGQNATTYLTQIQIQPHDAAVPLAVWYQPNPPTLDEAANVEALNLIPAKYHQRVLIPGLKMASRESKSDEGWKNMKADFEAGKRWMMAEEKRFQGQKRQLPSFFAR